jgi:hypothetical protein
MTVSGGFLLQNLQSPNMLGNQDIWIFMFYMGPILAKNFELSKHGQNKTFV